MATINVNWSRLHAEGVDPSELVKHLNKLEQEGFKVYFQVQNRNDLNVLRTMMTAQRTMTQPSMPQLAGLFALGILAGLVTISVGWIGLVR
jgi:hypothetical protein